MKVTYRIVNDKHGHSVSHSLGLYLQQSYYVPLTLVLLSKKDSFEITVLSECITENDHQHNTRVGESVASHQWSVVRQRSIVTCQQQTKVVLENLKLELTT